MADGSGSALGDLIRAGATLFVIGAAQSLIAGSPPKPQGVPSPLKQPVAPKWSGFGVSRRFSPPYLLFEISSAGGEAVDVLAGHAGRMNRWVEYWLHDDRGNATPGVDATTEEFGLTAAGWVKHRRTSLGRYGTEKVRLLSTLGDADAEALAPIVAQFNDGTWTEDHKGQGIALLAKVARRGQQQNFSRVYPNGDPLLTGVGEWQLYWDPRVTGCEREDPQTHVWGENGPLQLLHFLTQAEGGLGLDYESWIAPHLDTWIAAADDCDLPQALKAGGTEPRYRSGGGYYHTDDPADTIAKILGSFDGRLLPAADGAYCLYSGRFVVPEVTLTDADIIRDGTSLTRFRREDQVVNELQLQYTSRDHQWQMIDAPPWRDDDDIAARGAVRSETFAQEWVPSSSQMQRLGKRRFLRLRAPWYGQIRTKWSGCRALGKPAVRLQCPKLAAELNIPALADMMVEIEDAEPDFASLTCTFQVLKAPDLEGGVSPLDLWDPESEEATATEPRTKVPELDLVPPEISGVDIVSAGGVVTAAITGLVPEAIQETEDVTWFVRYQQGEPWSASFEFEDVPPGETVLLNQPLPRLGAVGFQIRYALSDGRSSEWSETFEVDSGTPAPPAENELAVSYTTPGAYSWTATFTGYIKWIGIGAGGKPVDFTWTVKVDEGDPKTPEDDVYEEFTQPAGGAGSGAVSEEDYFPVVEGVTVLSGYVGAANLDPNGGDTTVNELGDGDGRIAGGGEAGTADEDESFPGAGGVASGTGGVNTDGNDGGSPNIWTGGGAPGFSDAQDTPGANGNGPGGGGAQGGLGAHGAVYIYRRPAPP